MSFSVTGQCPSQWKLQPTPTPPPPPTRSHRTRSRPPLCRKRPLSPPSQALPFNQYNQPELLPPSNISRRQAIKLPICPLSASGDVSWTIHTVQSTQDNSQNIQATSPHAIIYRPISYQPAPVTQFDPHVHNLLVSAPVHHAHHAHPPPRWNIAKGITDSRH